MIHTECAYLVLGLGRHIDTAAQQRRCGPDEVSGPDMCWMGF